MSYDLTVFWDKLEANARFGGPRRYLRELLGDHLERALERAGVVLRQRIATVYPCSHLPGTGCRRVLWRNAEGGGARATCERRPGACATVEMIASDLEMLAVMPALLATAVGIALQIRVNVEMTEIREVYRVGWFVPDAGVKHAVYFLTRGNAYDYSEAIDALRFRAQGQTLAIFVPTDRFISENLRSHTAATGVPLLSLADSVGLSDERGFYPLVDPLRLFAGIGRPSHGSGPAGTAATEYVARALVRVAGRAAEWRDLDLSAYQRLVRDTAFDFVADELQKTVTKHGGIERESNISRWKFRWIRSCLENDRGRYDPGTGDSDGVSAKQMFQRARGTFDIKNRKGWSFFQTELVDKHAMYRFAPRASVTFAFIFEANTKPGVLPAESWVDDSQPFVGTRDDRSDTLVDGRHDSSRTPLDGRRDHTDTLVDARRDRSHTPVDTM